MKPLKDFIIEARKPNTPYVKPHMQDGKQVGWKSSNKWGKVKYWQDFAKESALKHAGITEGTYHIHMKNSSGKPVGKVSVWALDQKHAEEKAGKIVGKKPFRGHSVDKVTLAEAYIEDIEMIEESTHTISRIKHMALPKLRSQTDYWKTAHRNAKNDSMKKLTSDIYHAHRRELERRASVNEQALDEATAHERVKAHPGVESVDDGGKGDYFVNLKKGYHIDGQRSFGNDSASKALKVLKGVKKYDANDAHMYESVKIEKGETTEAGTRHEYRTARVMHDGKHVANINSYRGRAGGWTSQVDNPDGSSAHKKYGITLLDTKAEMLKKVKAHHKTQD